MPGRTKIQIAQTHENASKTAGDHHMMPGLIDPLVNAFNQPRRHLTTRGVAREQRVAETFVNTALFRDLYAEVGELRAIVSKRLDLDDFSSVRQFRSARRAA